MTEDPAPVDAPERPPRTMSRDARRVQLIEATIHTIAAQGLARTTLTQVARRAGLSHGLILWHFETKENLFRETLSYLAEEYHLNWQAALAAAGPHPADQLRAMMAADFNAPIIEPGRLAAWCAFWGEAQSRPLYQQVCGDKDDAYIRQLERICAALKPPAGTALDPVLAARMLRLVVQGTWLDMMTTAPTYSVAEAQRTVEAALAMCFPDYFAPAPTAERPAPTPAG